MQLPKIKLKWIIRLISVILVIAVTIIWAQSNPNTVVKMRKKLFPPTMVPVKSYILELRTTHPQCGHPDIEQKVYSSKYALNKALSKEAGFKYQKKVGNNYFYIKQGSVWCESCTKNQYLGIFEGKVAVFRGTPEKPGPVSETTEIRTDLLPKVELEDLKEGIRFADDKEKLQLLEGLDGLILN